MGGIRAECTFVEEETPIEKDSVSHTAGYDSFDHCL